MAWHKTGKYSFVSNRELQRLFTLYAQLLTLHGQDQKLAGLLSGAAYRLRKMNEEVTSLEKKELAKHFRFEILQVINQLQNSGTISALDELIQLTPPGLFEMMRIRGLGGKKLSLLWKVGKIDSLEALMEAAKTGTLDQVPGFGVKTQSNIIAAIESYQGNKDRYHFADMADTATLLVASLQKILKTKLVSTCGEVRRYCTTVAKIEIITAVSAKTLNNAALKKILVIDSADKDQTNAHTHDELPVTIYHTTEKSFHRDLFVRTGSEAHVRKMMETTKGHPFSEEAIYARAKLPFIVPEMREDNAEWTFRSKADELITLEDIKGVVHNHTTWSDGVDTLSDFVRACERKGYEYAVISDHSKNAHYAGGLKEEKLLRQLEEIDELNKKNKDFKIFKSVECDILVSGELDYNNEILKQLDLVIISVHQLLKMDEVKATKRLIKAIENPYSTILGHMTGRQLLIRPGYPVDFKKVIDACAANGVIIEINANPYRLDMDWSHIPYALSKGVMISINPDAHSIREIDNIRWGVAAARKGGLTKEMTWNAQDLTFIEQWLEKKKSKERRRKKLSR